MIVTIHQPEHLPWPGFFDKMRQADIFVLLDTTQFAKDDFQNRNRIKTAQGAVWLTVPVYKKKRSQQNIMDVEICNDRNWRNRAWQLITQNYSDAPFFSTYKPFFEKLYSVKWTSLLELNMTIIQYLADQLGLQTKMVRASELGVYEQGSTIVNLSICSALGADVYLSGKHGRHYLDETQFERQGIQVAYQDFQQPVYPQLWGEFISYMSTIDLLFNCGDSSLKQIATANPAGIQRKGIYEY